jgi:hypothetical protein
VTRFQPTTQLDVVRLSAWMRPADVAECRALSLTPLEAVEGSWRSSDFCTSLLIDGELAAIAGLVLEQGSALGTRVAQTWLLTTAVVEERPMEFHRAAKEWLRQASAQADVLWNYVDARYVQALRWLESLGFTIYPARPTGPLDMPFYLVVRE